MVLFTAEVFEHFRLDVAAGDYGDVQLCLRRLITVKEKAEDFYFPLDAQPELVRLDPNVSVLAQINFLPPAPMLAAQFAEKSDVMGRYIAIELYGERRDHEAITKLKTALNTDPYYAIRLAASKALRARLGSSRSNAH